MMESDMREVSVGHKSKAEVLSTSLQQMKACFLDTKLHKQKLLEAMAIFFVRSNRSGGDDHHAIEEIVCPCALCQESNMVLKRNRDGNFMVGCLGFPQCRNAVWLPGPVIDAAVTGSVCNSCSPGPVYLIQFKFRQLEIPPGFSVNHLGCIGGCDDTIRQLTEICGTGSRSQARGRPVATPSNPQQTSGRQSECIYCQHTSHTSNNCPSRRAASRNDMYHESGEASISCNTCGATCILRTANTVNNRGRKFYSCPSQNCQFFVWEDNLANGNTTRNFPTASDSRRASISTRRGGRSRSRSRSKSAENGQHAADSVFVSATGDPVTGNRCYRCGDPSHFANACPSRGF